MKRTPTPQPAISIVGCGRIGHAWGFLFRDAGYEVIGVSDNDGQKAEANAELFGCDVFEKILPCDIVFLCVPDGILPSVCKEISRYFEDRHTAFITPGGAVKSSALKAFFPNNPCASLHPIVAAPAEDADDKTCDAFFRKAIFSFEGDEEILPRLDRFVEYCEIDLIRIRAEDKDLYHAACCVAANYSVTLIDMAVKLLRSIHFSEESARTAMLNLMRNAEENLRKRRPAEALTGPIARGDHGTIEKHRTALRELDPYSAALYSHLAEATYAMLKENSLDAIRNSGEEKKR